MCRYRPDDLSKELPSASSITLYLRAETNTGKRKPWEKKLPFQISEHPFRVKTRTSLRDASAHIPMSPYPGTGKELCQTHQQQGKLFCLLCGPGVCRMSVRIQTALVADADAATVPGTAVCPHFQQFAVLGDGAVATDIEVVTYSPETTGLMVTK